MATLTPAQLSTMQFGYLNGSDLIRWSSTQVLIKQYEVDPECLQNGCDIAYSEVIDLFATKYDVVRELQAISSPRVNSFVKLVAIFAVRNILGNMAGLGEVTKNNYAWADDIVGRTQAGLNNFPLYAAKCTVNSVARLVKQNFGTLG